MNPMPLLLFHAAAAVEYLMIRQVIPVCSVECSSAEKKRLGKRKGEGKNRPVGMSGDEIFKL